MNYVYLGYDNLEVLKTLQSESFDLTYVDPPFNTGRSFIHVGGKFQDTFTWNARTDAELSEMPSTTFSLVQTATEAYSESMAAYLVFLGRRLLEVHRLLKNSGSIYLHCDDTAGHYLKILLDVLFGKSNFRNELIWQRAIQHGDATKYGRILDQIYYYGKSDSVYWNSDAIATDKTDAEILSSYPKQDEHGRFRYSNLTGTKHNVPGSPSSLPWRGYDIDAKGRHWAVPKTGKYAEYIEENFLPNFRSLSLFDRLDALDAIGLIYHPPRGEWPSLKAYATDTMKNRPQNLILEPKGFSNFSAKNEFVKYPTQKPVALLEKFILASSPPGGILLDPFCGSGSFLVAASKLGRRYFGIDANEDVESMLQKRLISSVSPADVRIEKKISKYYKAYKNC